MTVYETRQTTAPTLRNLRRLIDERLMVDGQTAYYYICGTEAKPVLVQNYGINGSNKWCTPLAPAATKKSVEVINSSLLDAEVIVKILVEVTIVKMRAVRVPIRLTVAPVARMFSDSATAGLANSSFSIKEKARQGRPAYLDFQATTPMDPRVLDAMMPYMISRYGNPHSRTHSYGWDTEKAVETAREDVASIIGASSKEIIFTSGATESNNLAIKGVARFYKGKKNHVITSQTEHKCVLDSCRALESEGFEVTYLPVQQNGIISLDDLKAAIRPTTVLLSIMGVNNEIGVLQPLKQIGEVFMTVM
jgi:hypothetical protein